MFYIRLVKNGKVVTESVSYLHEILIDKVRNQVIFIADGKPYIHTFDEFIGVKFSNDGLKTRKSFKYHNSKKKKERTCDIE